MEQVKKAVVYGDSLMKGTIMDMSYRYHAVMDERLKRFESRFPVRVTNKSRFGSTVERGYQTVEKDLSDGLSCDLAVIEFGGNDCNFKWNEVAAAPDREHAPMTERRRFEAVLRQMIAGLRARKITPVLMTLPPIDAELYLSFLKRSGLDCDNILKWLGDVQMIYRFHEGYSNAVKQIGGETGCPVVDVRAYFLDKLRYRELISVDGLHPSEKGYALVEQAFTDFWNSRAAAMPA